MMAQVSWQTPLGDVIKCMSSPVSELSWHASHVRIILPAFVKFCHNGLDADNVTKVAGAKVDGAAGDDAEGDGAEGNDVKADVVKVDVAKGDGAEGTGAKVAGAKVDGANVDGAKVDGAKVDGANVLAKAGETIAFAVLQLAGGLDDISHIPVVIKLTEELTRAYTPGLPATAHPLPNETTPSRLPYWSSKGPPESP